MKAIRFNNRVYRVTEERGSYIYYVDEKGKNRCVSLNEITEADESEIEVTKVKTYTKKLNKANFMSDDEYSRSSYAKMSKDDFDEMRRKDNYNTRSW